MKSKLLKKVTTSIFCACLCLTAGVALFACNESPKLEKIEVNTQDATVKFETGQEFTTEGLVVTATYSDKNTKDVTEYKAEAKLDEDTVVNVGETFTVEGAYTVTVTYEQKTATYDVQVVTPKAELTAGFENNVKATTKYLATELYAKSATLTKSEPYTVDDLKKEVTGLKFYEEVATLKNFDKVTSVTIGGQIFSEDFITSFSIGHNKFIQDKVWYVDAENKLFVAAPVLSAELSLDSTFKVNDVAVSHRVEIATTGELTSVTTEEPNTIDDEFDPEISLITVADPSKPFYFHFDGSNTDDYVFTKLLSEYYVEEKEDFVQYVQYGLSTVDGAGKFGLIIEWGKTAEEIYDSLNGATWNYSIFVTPNEGEAKTTVYTTDIDITVAEPALTDTENFLTDLNSAIDNLITNVYQNSASLQDQIYTFDNLKKQGEQFTNAQFYVAAGKLAYFSNEIESVTIGATTYGKEDKVLVSIGHNHFIEDVAWYVGEDKTLYIAAPVIKVEYALNEDDIFMINGKDCYFADAYPIGAEEITGVTTSQPNTASQGDDCWNVTLKETTTPFYFDFGAEGPTNVVCKTVKHCPDGSTKVQYGITPLEENNKFGCYFCYGDSIEGIYNVLNGQDWEISIVTNGSEYDSDSAYSAKLHFTLEK